MVAILMIGGIFCELCSNKFDEPSFKPYSSSHPELHDDFINRIHLFDNENCTLSLVSPNEAKVQLSTPDVRQEWNVHNVCDFALTSTFCMQR